jgi:hypothetical protein
MNIELNSKIHLTNEHSASSYGLPVLSIDGKAYGQGDDYSAALLHARDDYDPSDPLAFLAESVGVENQHEVIEDWARTRYGERSPEYKAVMDWLYPQGIGFGVAGY